MRVSMPSLAERQAWNKRHPVLGSCLWGVVCAVPFCAIVMLLFGVPLIPALVGVLVFSALGTAVYYVVARATS